MSDLELTLPEGPVRQTYKAFVRDRENVELMWVGGIGCSKSDALVTRAGLIADAYPGARSVVARSDSVKLNLTTRTKFLEKWDRPGIGDFRPSDNLFVWANGHTTIFLGLGDHKAIARLKSLEVVAVAIDEADEIDETTWEMALGRIRQQVRGLTPHRTVFGVANYEGRNWIWRRFKLEEPANTQRGRRLFEASTYDNHSLPSDYIQRLEIANGPEFIRRYVRGSWDAATGLVFPEFDPHHHVRAFHDSGQPPADWAYVVGIDHGFRNPTAATLWGIDARGIWHGVREYNESGLTPAENARNLKLWAGDARVMSWVMDPSAFNADPRQPGTSVATDYQRAGLPVTRGNNALEPGIARVRAMLRPFTDGPARLSRLYVDPSMTSLIREAQEWKWKDLRDLGREQPESGNDHALDSMRYAVMHVHDGFRSGPPKSAFRFEDEDDEDNDRPRKRTVIGGY